MKPSSVKEVFTCVKYLMCIFLFFLLTGCASDKLQRRDWQDDPANTAHCNALLRDVISPGQRGLLLDYQIYDFQSVVEEVLSIRQQIAVSAGELMQNNHKSPLPPAGLNSLKRLTADSMNVSHRIFNIVSANDCWFKAESSGLSPQGKLLRLKGMMLALSGSLVLFDTHLAIISALSEDARIRRFMDQSDIGYGIESHQLKSAIEFYESYNNRLLVHRMIQSWHTAKKSAPAGASAADSYRYLEMLIEQSPSYRLLKDPYKGRDEMIARSLEGGPGIISDHLYRFQRTGVGSLSRLFGNGIGMIESRRGKLYNDAEVRQKILESLRPGDILLEKTPFRLTDTFIPGHWGHAAVWVGTEKQLRELGIWNHPVVVRHHKEIQESKSVTEALRSGVQLNTLTHFMNIDDVAVLREPGMDSSRHAELVIQTLRQIGKAYDFNFDVETTDEIVCSELVYQVYTHIKWPTDKTAGRFTISPDNIAIKAINNGPFETVLLYHDGEEIGESEIEPLLQRLMPVSTSLFEKSGILQIPSIVIDTFLQGVPKNENNASEGVN